MGLIIAHHPYWSGPSAIVISLFGWFLGLRGVMVLAAPQLIARLTASATGSVAAGRLGFGVLMLIGFWLTFAGWIAKSERR